MQLSTAVTRLRDRYFNDFDLAGDANHSKTGDGKVSILDLQRVASGKRFNGGSYPPDEIDVAKSILGNLAQFEANLGNKNVFTKEDLKFDDSHYKNGNDPKDGKITYANASNRRKYALLLNVFDQVDVNHNGKINENGDIAKFLTPALKKNYKATYDALQDIVNNKMLPTPLSKGELGDLIAKLQ